MTKNDTFGDKKEGHGKFERGYWKPTIYELVITMMILRFLYHYLWFLQPNASIIPSFLVK